MSPQSFHDATVHRVLSREHGIIDDDLEGGLVGGGRYSTLSEYLHTAATYAKNTLLDLSYTLLPSFLLSQLRPTVSSGSSSHTRYTSALDGIRGLACIAVMNYHLMWIYVPHIHLGYGLSQQDLTACISNPQANTRNDWFLQLPIVRLLFSGTGSVSVFFIIAGFVLAYKPLTLSRKGRWLDIFSTLASCTFRRGIRLYLPAIAAIFCGLITFRFGWWQGINQPARQPTVLLQILDWLQDLYMMMNIWSWTEYRPRYAFQLWTISIEVRASMVIFLTLPVYVMMRRPFQMILLLLIIFYAYVYLRWEIPLFLCGILLADISQARQLRSESKRQATHHPILLGARPPRDPTWRVVLMTFAQAILLAFALFILSAPDFCIDSTPGYRILSRFIPPFDDRFYPSFGAFLTVFLVSSSSPSWVVNRYILNSSLLQYFGRISFSLYLVHVPLIYIVSDRIFTWVWSLTGRDSLVAYCAGFGIAYGLFFALGVWVADIFWRVVDIRSVRFARWLERYVTISVAERSER